MSSSKELLVQALVAGHQKETCSLLDAHNDLHLAELPDLSDAARSYAPLHIAAFTGQQIVTQKLLDLGADPSNAAGTHKNWTPLHFAAQHRHAAVATILLDGGADVSAQDADGRTPLHWAAINNAPAIAKLLLAKGANRELSDGNKMTPGAYAQEHQHFEVARLIDQGS